jgi:transcriptional regulator with XRE-family HTH domain
MNISANLKRLRRERELTQEKLAEILGVVPQAVSKWERGEGLPDITLVPSIAAALGVTTDALFGMDAALKERRVKEILAEWGRVQTLPDGGFDNAAGIAFLRDKLREFPGEWELWRWLAISLVHNSGIGTDDYNEKNILEAVGIWERIAEQCADTLIRDTAVPSIVTIYASIGEGGKAQEYSKRLAHKHTSYEYMAPWFLPGKERRAFIETEISDTVMHINDLIYNAVGNVKSYGVELDGCGYTLEEQLELLELGTRMFELIKDQPWGGLWAERCCHNFYTSAELLLSQGETNRALDYLERAALYCLPFEGEKRARIALSPPTEYAGETENIIPTENARQGFLLILDQAAEYGGENSLPNRLCGEPRYTALVERLRNMA